MGNKERGKRLTRLRVPSSSPARHGQMSNDEDALGVSEGNEVVDGMQESEESPMVWSSASIASSNEEELQPER
jgi:hypothetical protein